MITAFFADNQVRGGDQFEIKWAGEVEEPFDRRGIGTEIGGPRAAVKFAEVASFCGTTSAAAAQEF